MIIQEVRLHNFKKFRNLSIVLHKEMNLLVGDNEAGKTSILEAVDLALSGSRSKVETIGLETLFFAGAIEEFQQSERKYADLPELYVDIYLEKADNPNSDWDGKDNGYGERRYGIRFVSRPIDDYRKEIVDLLAKSDENFPFEYYGVQFLGFSGMPYNAYAKRPVRHVSLDSSRIGDSYATREYVRSVFSSISEPVERHHYNNEYRKMKATYVNTVFKDLNDGSELKFGLLSDSKSNLESDLTLTEDGIPLESKGKGRQVIIKTVFTIEKKEQGDNTVDLILLEEPENHLSHTSLRLMLSKLSASTGKQIVISTHNSLIVSRLDLRRAFILGVDQQMTLDDLPESTASFFIKAPSNNILEFVLARKVLLVEGPSEYLLTPVMLEKTVGQSIEALGVHVISIGGLSFRRYMHVAKVLGIKVAVVRDNDGDVNGNCIEAYSEFADEELIEVFYEEDPDVHTFEVAVFDKNPDLCTELFGKSLKKKSVIDHMLSNKTECSLALLEKRADELVVPDYIAEACQWLVQ